MKRYIENVGPSDINCTVYHEGETYYVISKNDMLYAYDESSNLHRLCSGYLVSVEPNKFLSAVIHF